jgi:hypothetical protein
VEKRKKTDFLFKILLRKKVGARIFRENTYVRKNVGLSGKSDKKKLNRCRTSN